MPRIDARYRITIRNWSAYQRKMRGDGVRRRRRDWVALSTDLCRDPDILALTIEQRWLWVALITHAGRVGEQFDVSASTARKMFSLRPGWRAATDFAKLAELGFIEVETLVEGQPMPQKKKKKKAAPKDEPIPYPDGLNVEAWEHYMQYRRDNGLRKYKPKYAKQAMNKWAKYPLKAQAEAVQQTIDNNWQGVFPEKHVKDQPLTEDQREQKRRADVAALSRLMQIERAAGEPWELFAKRVFAANDRRIAAQQTGR